MFRVILFSGDLDGEDTERSEISACMRMMHMYKYMMAARIHLLQLSTCNVLIRVRSSEDCLKLKQISRSITTELTTHITGHGKSIKLKEAASLCTVDGKMFSLVYSDGLVQGFKNQPVTVVSRDRLRIIHYRKFLYVVHVKKKINA